MTLLTPGTVTGFLSGSLLHGSAWLGIGPLHDQMFLADCSAPRAAGLSPSYWQSSTSQDHGPVEGREVFQNITRRFPAQTVSGGVPWQRVCAVPLEHPAPWTEFLMPLTQVLKPHCFCLMFILCTCSDREVRIKQFQHRAPDLTFREMSGESKQRKN